MLSRMAMMRAPTARGVSRPMTMGNMGPKAFMGVYTGDRSHVKTPQPTPEEANTHRPDPLLRWEKASTTKQVQHYTSYALGGGLPLALMMGAPLVNVLDFAFAVIIPLHTHIGLRSVIVDYVYNPKQQNMALKVLAGFTVLTAFGMTKLNLMDVGVTGAVKTLWTV